MIRVLLYGDVDLNLIDGSSIWLASLAEMLGGAAGVQVTVLQKTRLTRDVVTRSAAALPNVSFLDPWAPAGNCTEICRELTKAPAGRLSPESAAALIKSLDQEAAFDVVFVRSIEVANILTNTRDVASRLFVYVTDPLRYASPDECARLRQITERCNTIACQTEEAKSTLLTLLDIGDADRLVLLPPMIPALGAGVQRALDPAAPRLGYSGKFSPPYMILEMLDAFDKIRARAPGAEFHVVGDKFHNVPPVENFVEAVTRRLSMTPGVIWHGGVSRTEANEILRQVHIAASWRAPSFDESLEMSTKILEYSALGIPVLMNPSPIQRRIFGADYPAYVTSEREFVDCVLTLTASPALYDHASQSIQATAAEYTYKSHRRRLLPVLKDAAPRIRVLDRTPTILWVGHDFKFLRLIRETVERVGPYRGLTDEYKGHVIRNPERSRELLSRADIIFCEWCLGNAEWYSKHKRPNQRLVVRFHRQEIDLQFLHKIRWEGVDRIIFIAEWVMDKFLALFPLMKDRAALIYNAIDCRELDVEKLFGAEFNLGLLGYCPRLKAPHLAFEILSQLKRIDRRYTLFIKGKSPQQLGWLWKRSEERRYYEDLQVQIDQSPYSNSVVFEPHGHDVPTWLSKVGYILSTSQVEGSHQALAEGMASGAIPVIRNWPGAELIYPRKHIFGSAREAAELVHQWGTNGSYHLELTHSRGWAQKCDLHSIAKQYLGMIVELLGQSGGAPIMHTCLKHLR